MHKWPSGQRPLFGRIGRWLADGQAPGSVDLVRLARGRSQPPRSPRRYRPDRRRSRIGGLRGGGGPGRRGPGLGPRAGRASAGAQALGVAAWCGCCCTMPYVSAMPAPPASPALAGAAATRWSARAPGRRRSRSPRPPWRPWMPTWAGRAYSAAVPGWRQLAGSVLATAGGRLGQGRLWELVRCRVRTAGIGARGAALAALLRRSAITVVRDAGAPARRPGLRQPQRPPHHRPA